jgi:hypothetical protein
MFWIQKLLNKIVSLNLKQKLVSNRVTLYTMFLLLVTTEVISQNFEFDDGSLREIRFEQVEAIGGKLVILLPSDNIIAISLDSVCDFVNDVDIDTLFHFDNIISFKKENDKFILIECQTDNGLTFNRGNLVTKKIKKM